MNSTWSRSDRRVPRLLVRALQSFLDTEAAGGILLLLAAAAALVWANSPWRGTYDDLWHTTLTFRLGPWAIEEDLRHWVNDALMSIFFFVVGLEIKRELTIGELRDPRRAALPVLAAIGGMVVPALLYLAINPTGDASRGWGIPMATDIAFALGVLTLVGPRCPPALKLFLLALAIVDDIGAILVIAVFYSGGLELAALGAAAGLLVLIVILQRVHVRSSPVYVVLGVAVWFATFESGIHPTIAGVALGLLTPAIAFQRPAAVSDEARRVADETVDDPRPPDADAHHWLYLTRLSRDAVSPLGRMEHLLHPWSSYVIIPLFALANAGVSLSFGDLREAVASPIWVGVMVGLVVGKPLGVVLGAVVGVRLGLARLPSGSSWWHVVGAGALAGIGFTVSLFIAGLAFTTSEREAVAKVGILTASLAAGAAGALVLSRTRRTDLPREDERDIGEALMRSEEESSR
ncbi:MAG: Na+/H+ antiporter NhaA [Actinobacteria bacterium]|nr:Na+/H+ antiporter NhaA [Actinomycetota bacterium]